MRAKNWLIAGSVFVVAFVGGFAALQLNSVLSKKESPTLFSNSQTVTAIPAQNSALSNDFRAASKRILESVVSIDTQSQGEDFFGRRFVQQSGSGSGVVISEDGYVVTNNHVVSDRGRQVDRVAVVFSDGKSLEAEIVGRDPRSDIAVLKVNQNGLKPISIGNSDKLEIGEWVIAAGNPLGYRNTISVGVVSSKGRPLAAEDSAIFVDGIQTDAAINQGNSGGALCDANGNLVGINVAIASNSGGSIGIGFAIPVNRMKAVVDDIIKDGFVKYGTTGFFVRDDSGLILNLNRYRQQLKRAVGTDAEPPQEGVVIGQIASGSPAARVGIRPLDVILSVNGKAMKELKDYQVFIADKRPGEKLEVKLWSAGTEKTVSVVLAESLVAEQEF